MRKYNLQTTIILALIICIGYSTSAQAPAKTPIHESPVKWYSFEEAYSLIKKKPKKIFIEM